MYADDHDPPHFHIRGIGWNVSVDLQTMNLTAGLGPAKEIAEAIQWAGEHQTQLYLEWSRLNERD